MQMLCSADLQQQNQLVDRRMQKQGMSKGANYKHSQIFGYKGPNEKIMEEDIISAMKFDSSGRYLSLGDRAGRIIIFETPENSKKKDQQFEYYAEFQSHSREFDPLRSMDVQQEITAISWMKNQGKYLKLLTTNTRNIKLWKVFEKTQKKVVKSAGKDLNMPKLQTIESAFVAQVQKNFPCKHLTSINSISTTLNQEYLLSTDEIQAFLWNVEYPNKPFLVADLLQAQKVEDVKQNITCGKLHPTSDSLFVFGTNKGGLKMADLRLSALSDNTALNFKCESPGGQKNFFTEMISSYSSADFIKGGKFIVSRDFLTVKVWDICNTKKPVNTITVQDSIKGKLCQMFENDCIFDKFNVSCSPCGNTVLTGNYNNSFHLIDIADSSNTQYELNYKKNTISRPILPNKGTPIQKMDYIRKTVANDFNPKKCMLAVASLNCFYIYGM